MLGFKLSHVSKKGICLTHCTYFPLHGLTNHATLQANVGAIKTNKSWLPKYIVAARSNTVFHSDREMAPTIVILDAIDKPDAILCWIAVSPHERHGVSNNR